MIPVESKTLISHVVDLFPGETDFTFICAQPHLDDPELHLREELRAAAPEGRIVGIAAHKRGPVHAVQQVADLIDSERPVVVNYCDFSCFWDWTAFKFHAASTGSSGIIPAYKGFHPHSLGSTLYAYLREENGQVRAVQEKQPFTSNPIDEYASTGTYYFSSGRLMLEAIDFAVQMGLHTNGEFYSSSVYDYLLLHGLLVTVYPVQHFMQWGTPEDLEEYSRWSDVFRRLLRPRSEQTPSGSVIMPMAGLGKRFSRAGYFEPKPVLPVSGKPMSVQSTQMLPPAKAYSFVLRQDMDHCKEICRLLENEFPDARVTIEPKLTDGQAQSVAIGVSALRDSAQSIQTPITVGACDIGLVYQHNDFLDHLRVCAPDVTVWVTEPHASAKSRPEMFGWVRSQGEHIRDVFVKQAPSGEGDHHVISGVFTFRDETVFAECWKRLQQRDGRVNGEFYLDSLLEDALALGFTCSLFKVDGFLPWGTPEDYETFRYWQSCFHKWNSHPYRLENDWRVLPDEVKTLSQSFCDWPHSPPSAANLS